MQWGHGGSSERMIRANVSTYQPFSAIARIENLAQVADCL
jgi:hypothetical protein